MKRPIDMEAVQTARRNLERIARDNPGMRKITTEEVAGVMKEKEAPRVKQEAFTLKEVGEILGCHGETVRRPVLNGGSRIPAPPSCNQGSTSAR